MVLVFDSGNSNLKVGIFKKNKLLLTFRLNGSITAKKVYSIIVKKIKKEFIKGIAICSVVPEVKKQLIKLSEKYFLIKPILINQQTKINFINLYKNKKMLGEDRIANMVAAEYLYKKKNKIIIDYGTAITFDVLNNKGEFLGGVIMPGFNLVLKTLNQNTAQLPLIKFKSGFNFLGRTTEDCILAGLNAIGIGSIKYLITVIKKYFKMRNVIIILTGGDSNFLILKMLNEKKVILKKDLCLFGIKIIYDLNS